MAEYRLTARPSTVIRTADEAHIPNDPLNPDWVEYQRWLAEGGVPDPYVPVYSRREEADMHRAGGLTVDFPGAAPGRGTYSVVPPYSDNINAIQTNLNTNGRFPNNTTAVGVFDMQETMHMFDKKYFPLFSDAVSTFVHDCNLYAAGEMIYLPPNEVIINA